MIINNPVLCQKANNVKLNLYSFGYATVKSEWNGFVKEPSFTRLYYIISGKAYIKYGNEVVNLLPGNWYLIPARLSFDFGCDDKMEQLYFHISLSGIDEIDLLGNFEVPYFWNDDTKPHLFYKKHLDNKSLFSALIIKERINNIVISLIKKSGLEPEIIEFSECVLKAVEYINNNLCKKLDLTTISENSYVSKCTLTNKFKSELKITIHDYIQQQKMFKAGQLLKNTNMSVAEISESLGFSEQFYFSRCFKNSHGLSPREYRKSNIN